jgi:hypothetical protein
VQQVLQVQLARLVIQDRQVLQDLQAQLVLQDLLV